MFGITYMDTLKRNIYNILLSILVVVIPLFLIGLITNDVNAESVITTIRVGNGPGGIAFNSASGKLYVANSADNTVSVIDHSTNKVVGKPIPVGDHPIGIAFNPASGKLLVSNYYDHTVSVINHSTNKLLVNLYQ